MTNLNQNFSYEHADSSERTWAHQVQTPFPELAHDGFTVKHFIIYPGNYPCNYPRSSYNLSRELSVLVFTCLVYSFINPSTIPQCSAVHGYLLTGDH
eukprot:g51141.t1